MARAKQEASVVEASVSRCIDACRQGTQGFYRCHIRRRCIPEKTLHPGSGKSHLIRVAGELCAVAGTERQSDSIWEGLCFSRDTWAVLLTPDWAE